MGVQTKIAIYGDIAQACEDAAARAFGRISDLEAIMSDYRRDSELSRLCDDAGGPPKQVSLDLFRVLALSRQVSERTDGAFDITVGPLVALWRSSRQSGKLPDAAALVLARAPVGWRNVRLEAGNRTVQLAMAGMRLDLGGIGKGYAAQAAVDQLRSEGFSNVLVSLAGDIVLGDPPPGQAGWRIEVSAGSGLAPAGTLLLSNAAVSTSGDAEQFIEIEGARYSHIVDPRTGLGVAPHRAVTIVASRGELADAIGKAACIWPRERVAELLRKFPATAAVVQYKDGDAIRCEVHENATALVWDGAAPSAQ